jgi:hypothetical protein
VIVQPFEARGNLFLLEMSILELRICYVICVM